MKNAEPGATEQDQGASEMEKCRKCGKEILWIRTKSGKWMPCDPDPVRFDAGGPDIFVTKYGETVKGTVSDAGLKTGFVPHWATCRYADDFRKKKRGE